MARLVRIIVIIGLLLAGGAIITWLVAWAIWSDTTRQVSGTAYTPPPPTVPLPSDIGLGPRRAQARPAPPPRAYEIRSAGGVNPVYTVTVVQHIGRSATVNVTKGWPRPMVRGSLKYTANTVERSGVMVVDDAMPVAPAWQWSRQWETGLGVFPLVPIWRPFLLSAAGWAVVLALLVFTPRLVRRWRRGRAGRCVACGYPTGASTVCTECGRAV